MGARKGWENLSADQRNRYIRAGRTGRLTGTPGLSESQARAYYESGGTLKGGRGHGTFVAGPGGSKRIVQTAPSDTKGKKRAVLGPELLERLSLGSSTDADRKALEAWRKRGAPKWIPKDRALMSDDVAALIAGLGSPPSRWAKVVTTTKPDGTVLVEVTTKSGETNSVLLPDRDALHEFTRWLPNAAAGTKGSPTDVRIGGTDLPKTRARKATSSTKKAPKKVAPKKAPAGGKTTAKKTQAKKAAPKKAAKKAAPTKAKKATKKAAPRKRTARVPTLGELLGDALEAAGDAIESAGDILG